MDKNQKTDKIIKQCFSDGEEISTKTDDEGITEIRGIGYCLSVPLKLTITRTDLSSGSPERKRPKPLYTGTISIVDPATSKVMLSEVRRRLLENKGKAPSKKDTYASITFQCNSSEPTVIASKLTQQINTLIETNKSQLKDSIKRAMTPEELTLQEAADYYLFDFLKQAYPQSSAENNTKRTNKLQKAIKFFPYVPISQLKPRQVSNIIAVHHITDSASDLCFLFVEYLINMKKCIGSNPFPSPSKREPSAASIQHSAFAMQELGDATFERMFFLLNKAISSINCAIALLASGFPLSDIRALTWADIEFKSKKDFVVIHIKRDYATVSKHDYSRPAIPDTALYLRRAFDQFTQERGKETVLKEKIISSNLNNQFIASEVRNILVRSGFSGELSTPGRPEKDREVIPVGILQSNYQRALISKAGLKDDPDTFHFLSGMIFKSSTFTSYESHTSPEALERLYTILLPISSEKRINRKTKCEVVGGEMVYTAVPKTNHEAVRVSGTVTLKAGERIVIKVPHGVKGVVEIVKPDD